METLLQKLLQQALPDNISPILSDYVAIVLPRVEQEFGVVQSSKVQSRSILTQVLNGLLITCSLSQYLSTNIQLTDDELRSLCLSFTLFESSHQINNHSPIQETLSKKRDELISLDEKLELTVFWSDWIDYLPAIIYLMSISEGLSEEANWIVEHWNIQIDQQCLDHILSPLLTFGTIASQIVDPADIVSTSEGDRLHSILEELGSDRLLTYHKLRSQTGLLGNSIHTSVMQTLQQLDWHPLLFFSNGIVYLKPGDDEYLERTTIQEAAWDYARTRLIQNMLNGNIGFNRSGKGLKVAPIVLEFCSPTEILEHLPEIIVAGIKNEKDPATPKRLNKLDLSTEEKSLLVDCSDLRSDRLAEFIIFAKRYFFHQDPHFNQWVLDTLEIESKTVIERIKEQSGGVSYGWYYVSAFYISDHSSINLSDITVLLQQLADQLIDRLNDQQARFNHDSETCHEFYRYLSHELELPDCETSISLFNHELDCYISSKSSKQPICSLGSGLYASEEQMDSIVLFKPQQYSNKNRLGSNRIKRGISTIWSMEMLLRREFWSVPTGYLEDRNPVFLTFFPACNYSTYMLQAMQLLFSNLRRINLWEVRRFWRGHNMDAGALRYFPWLHKTLERNAGKQLDLPLTGLLHTTTRGKTGVEAWVEPGFLVLALSLVLGIKGVASASPVPASNSVEMSELVRLDGPANFWSELGLPTSFSLSPNNQPIDQSLNRLLTALDIHLKCKGESGRPQWQFLPETIHHIHADQLELFDFILSNIQSNSFFDIEWCWNISIFWQTGANLMDKPLELTQRLVREYRTFYKVHVASSRSAIVLPLKRVIDDILLLPIHLPIEMLIFQITGQLSAALRRQEAYERPIIMDTSLSIEVRRNNEEEAIQQFVTTCVEDLFLGMYKGDRALLQENRNHIQAGAEVVYRIMDRDEAKAREQKEGVADAPAS